MMNLSIGVSALQANQSALSVVGHNIANANTEGYHRQHVIFHENLSVRLGDFRYGTGVHIGDIRRLQDAVAESSLAAAISDSAGATEKLALVREVETLFSPASGSLQDQLESLFNEMERLTALPTDSALRAGVVRQAQSVANEINRVSNGLANVESSLMTRALGIADTINDLTHSLADINVRIRRAVSSGSNPNDLLDRRDAQLKELSELIGVSIMPSTDGPPRMVLSGLIPIDETVRDISVVSLDDGSFGLQIQGWDPIPPVGGKLGAINSLLGDNSYRNQLDQFTRSLFETIDGAHASGLGTAGSFRTLTGTRPVDDPTASLSSLPQNVQSGELYITVTDTSTQALTTHRIDINSDSTLNDLVSQIQAISNLNASVETSGAINIKADTSFQFDFTGRPTSEPDTGSITGSAQPRIDGVYTGSQNDAWTFTFQSTGAIGVDQDLALEVRNSLGELVTLVDVGNEYEPNSRLRIADGVSITLPPGTANAGDSFTVDVVSDPDTTGVLAALGLNSLFTGQDSHDIAVRGDILANPTNLATTVDGTSADTTNLLNMIAARAKPLNGAGTRTLEGALADLTSSVGLEVRDAEEVANNANALATYLEELATSVAGVDQNEELARMLQYQRSFQASSRYISAIDEVLFELLEMVR